MTKRLVRDALEDRVCALYRSGATCEQIARQVGWSPMTVYRITKKAGITLSLGARSKGKPNLARRRFDRGRAREMYAAGLSSTQIGKQLGVSKATVLRAFHDEGVDVRSNHESNSLRARGKKGASSHGYVRVNVGNRERQYEHILIAEKVLGRPLKRLERVHHVYGDRSDNRNLLICTHQYHLALHHRIYKKYGTWNLPPPPEC